MTENQGKLNVALAQQDPFEVIEDVVLITSPLPPFYFVSNITHYESLLFDPPHNSVVCCLQINRTHLYFTK